MSGDIKVLRGQVRQIVQEMLPQVMGEELIAAIEKALSQKQADFQKTMQDILVQRLDKIEKECNVTLKKQDERARAVQGFLVQSAVNDLNGFVGNMHVTMTAWEEVMIEKIGDKTEFNKLVDEKKKEVQARFKAEKEAKMAADIASKNAAIEEVAKAGNPDHPEQGPPNAEQPAQPPGGEEKSAEEPAKSTEEQAAS
jgi:hypothetical protein